jgi:hypothetical protein
MTRAQPLNVATPLCDNAGASVPLGAPATPFGRCASPVEWRRLDRSPYRSYEVSSDGRVRRNGRELKGRLDRYGYRSVLLSYAGLSRCFKGHRLVCEAWSGPCPEGSECGHLDGNRLNNSPDNLAWVTRKENTAHKKLQGRPHGGRRSRLSDETLAEIKRSPLSSREAALVFGVSQSRIVRIRNTVSALRAPAAIAGGSL